MVLFAGWRAEPAGVHRLRSAPHHAHCLTQWPRTDEKQLWKSDDICWMHGWKGAEGLLWIGCENFIDLAKQIFWTHGADNPLCNGQYYTAPTWKNYAYVLHMLHKKFWPLRLAEWAADNHHSHLARPLTSDGPYWNIAHLVHWNDPFILIDALTSNIYKIPLPRRPPLIRRCSICTKAILCLMFHSSLHVRNVQIMWIPLFGCSVPFSISSSSMDFLASCTPRKPA